MSALLVVLILLGSLSVLSGVRVVSGPDHPQVTLDVCHPLQTLNGISKVFLAHPDPGSISEPVLHFQGTIPDSSKHNLIDLAFAPDPPPPKAPI